MLLTAAVAVSCRTVDSAESKENIAVSSSINATTRTPNLNGDGSGQFAEGDKIGLVILDAEGKQTPEFKMNYESTPTGTTTLYWDDIKTGGPLTFTGYYPYDAAVTAANVAAYDFSVVDGVEVAGAKYVDLLLAKPVEHSYAGRKGNTPVELTFNHSMHRLVVQIARNEVNYSLAVLQAAQIEFVNVLPVAVADLSMGVVDPENSKGTAVNLTLPNTATTTDAVCFERIVAPQMLTRTNDVADQYLTIKVLNAATGKVVTYAYYLPGYITVGTERVRLDRLESGKQLTIRLSLTKSQVHIDDITIEAWGTQGEYNTNGGWENNYD